MAHTVYRAQYSSQCSSGTEFLLEIDLIINIHREPIGNMARRKTGLESTAFEPPFYNAEIGSHSYNIPEEYETLLIDIYTKYTEEAPDIDISLLPELMENDLNVPREIVPTQSELKSWAIEGTEILDFEKWLYNGFFWLLLGDHTEDIDLLWIDIWSNLTEGKSSDISSLEQKESLRAKKLYFADITKLISIGKIDASAMGMLQTGGNGKLFVTYVDFFIILGRLGAFQ